MTPRYDLPPDLTPEEERAVLAALEAAFGGGTEHLSPWALAGRAENLRLGRLQTRHRAERGWTLRGNLPFSRHGTPSLHGRGDAR